MYRNGVKRIAVCFSGQPRTWRKCIDTWHNILLQNGRRDHVDVFCHLWNFNTVSNAAGVNNSVSEPVSQEEISELIKFLNPKKILIESEKSFTAQTDTQVISVPSWLSQFYGIMRSARLKKEFEIDNDLMYDVVVRARYDAVYETRISDSYQTVTPNTMHGFHFGWHESSNRGRMGDISWFSDSMTYDIISDYYLNLSLIDKKWFGPDWTPEQVFFHYIKKNNINIESNHWSIKLMRPSQELSFTKSKDGYETW